MNSHGSQMTEQSRSGGRNRGQHSPVIAGAGRSSEAGLRSSWEVKLEDQGLYQRVMVKHMAAVAQERAKNRGPSLIKPPGDAGEPLAAFPQSPLFSSLTQGHVPAGLEHRQPNPQEMSGLLALTYILVVVCVICSFIALFCIELEDHSDTSVLKTDIKLDKFS